MNTRTLRIKSINGLDQGYFTEPDLASKMVNWTARGLRTGWSNKIGFEKFFPGPTSYSPFYPTKAIYSTHIWKTHAGRRQYYLYEENGGLYFTIGNAAAKQLVDTNRHIPLPTEMATDYVETNNSLVLVNGSDRPIKYKGELQLRNLGWTQQPSAPFAWDVTTLPLVLTSNTLYLPANETIGEDGLGFITNAELNAHRWKVAFVNEDGSESPMSTASNRVQWTTSSTFVASERYILYLEIPVGPVGTVARRIYRTKNMGDLEDGAAEVYYFAGQVNNNHDTGYYDGLGDNSLGSEAPLYTESIILPTNDAYTGANYLSRLFLVGKSNPYVVYYSNRGFPDTFSAADILTFGQAAGQIVKLHPYNDILLVFRENGISVIYERDGFIRTTDISNSVGTTAGKTITTIPDVGVFFLSYDGVYAITGGLTGAADISAKKVSGMLDEENLRICRTYLPTACAAYSHKWREWHCYCSVDGQYLVRLGYVFHADRNCWTTRENFPIGTLAVDYEGNLIFGHIKGSTTTNNLEQQGLFVITGNRYLGEAGSGDVLGNGTAVTSEIHSAWIDIDSPEQRKEFLRVSLLLLSQGDNALTVNSYRDYEIEPYTTYSAPVQVADRAKQGIYGTSVIGTGKWENYKLTEVVFDVYTEGAVSKYKLGISTTSDLIILGWTIDIAPDAKKVNQPWRA